jgi:hypothetical protein
VEQRTVVSIAVMVAMATQSLMPVGFRIGPLWLLPAVAAALVVVIFIAGRSTGDPGHPVLRLLALGLAGVLAVGNIVSVATLVHGLLSAHAVHARQLFAIGTAAWVTNVVAFAVTFWEIDAGGPVRRAQCKVREHGEFLFPQYSLTHRAQWTPRFLDYLYVSFTNATAFSPTDTLPLTGRAKSLMAVQSAVALVAIAVVFARGVNIIGA